MSLTSDIKQLFKKMAPLPIVRRSMGMLHERRFRQLHRDVLAYFEEKSKHGTLSAEERPVLDHLRNHFISVFPYAFSAQYRPEQTESFLDAETGLPYVLWHGKKLFLKRGTTPYDIEVIINALHQEQDPQSPHRYLTEEFRIAPGSVIVDVGAAEGNFSLQCVEEARKIYIIEADDSWKEALEATFRPWKDKVEIIYKFASDTSGPNEVSMDELYRREGRIDFLKIDVEGAELKVLEGARALIADRKPLQVALCTYHQAGDAERFAALLRDMGFSVQFSDNHMIFLYDEQLAPPYLRKGLIRATMR